MPNTSCVTDAIRTCRLCHSDDNWQTVAREGEKSKFQNPALLAFIIPSSDTCVLATTVDSEALNFFDIYIYFAGNISQWIDTKHPFRRPKYMGRWKSRTKTTLLLFSLLITPPVYLRLITTTHTRTTSIWTSVAWDENQEYRVLGRYIDPNIHPQDDDFSDLTEDVAPLNGNSLYRLRNTPICFFLDHCHHNTSVNKKTCFCLPDGRRVRALGGTPAVSFRDVPSHNDNDEVVWRFAHILSDTKHCVTFSSWKRKHLTNLQVSKPPEPLKRRSTLYPQHLCNHMARGANRSLESNISLKWHSGDFYS